MNPTIRKRIFNGLFVLIILLLIWPTSRSYFHQGLMKIGLFKPTLEKPQEADLQKTIPAKKIVSFKNAQGEVVDIDDLKGKVVFINFWATWCPPCVAEMPSIATLYDKFKDNKDVVFLIVEIEGEAEKAQAFMDDKGLPLPVSYPNSEIPEEWLGGSIPTTIMLDKAGEIAARHEGLADYSRQEVVDFMNELLIK